jgi:hypothetical protein
VCVEDRQSHVLAGVDRAGHPLGTVCAVVAAEGDAGYGPKRAVLALLRYPERTSNVIVLSGRHSIAMSAARRQILFARGSKFYGIRGRRSGWVILDLNGG